MTLARAAFLDRDGVINVEKNYVHRIADFEFIPGVLEACRRIAEAGYLLIIVTNQAGIARGYYGEPEFAALTRWMSARFADAGAPLAAVYHCPHHPEATLPGLRKACDCRKPEPGLILRAAREHSLDLGHSLLVGDKRSDIEAGRRAGVGRCFLIEQTAATDGATGAEVVRSLSEVAERIA